MKKIATILTLALLPLGWYGCGTTTPEPDPCAGHKPLKADFQILEQGINEFDTISWTGGFLALCDADSFYWKIGRDPRVFTGKKVVLGFIEAKDHTWYDITLIVKKRKTNPCSEKTADTLTKRFYLDKVMSSFDYQISPIFGTFEGEYAHNPGTKVRLSFEFVIRKISVSPPVMNRLDSVLTIKGIEPYTQCNWFTESGIYGRSFFVIDFNPITDPIPCSRGLKCGKGMAYIDYKTKKLIMDYEYYTDQRKPDAKNITKRHFEGKKIN